ncbi:MAG TPA: serine/threonine-protein kinase [Anaerolineaceae bacterium]|nr:serine/threonine-protein kinase [Anaerolineaceae bacterium]
MASTVFGRKYHWQLREQIGKGDAGEVLRVQTELGRERGLMKRPVQNVSGGTILRQAVQIENEGKVLAALNGLDVRRNNLTVHTPLLLDQSPEGTSKTAALFIVSEEVRGIAISNLLKNLLQKNASFSQTLVLKVLSSLFTLLSRVHALGIAWNDVKMEHIFWDETTNTLSFIDWGNGLFFDPDEAQHPQHPVRLDYQQFVSEGSLLLNQIAPDLISEIDWPQEDANLTPEALLQLQHRVEYMEAHLSMRIKEYQLAFDKSSRQINSLAELQDILELKQALGRLGVQVQTQTALQSVRRFALSLAQANAYPEVHALVELLRTYLPEDASQSWQLVDYLLSLEDAWDQPAFPVVLEKTIANDLPAAIWELEGARESSGNLPRLINIQLAMRSAAGVPDALRDTLLEQLRAWLDDTYARLLHTRQEFPAEIDAAAALETFASNLDALLSNWQNLGAGEMLGDKLLLLRDLLRSPGAHLTNLPQSLSQALNLELAKTREILTFWTEGELNKSRDALKNFFLLEPTMPYLREISAGIEALKGWMDELSRGPQPWQSVNAFGRGLLERKPDLAKFLSQPAWLASLVQCAEALAAASDGEMLRLLAENNQWPIPWVDYGEITIEFRTAAASTRMNAAQKDALAGFHQALCGDQDLPQALSRLKSLLPGLYGQYRLLAQGFETLFTPLPAQTQAVEAAAFPPADRQNVVQALEVLDYLKRWKESQLDAGTAMGAEPPAAFQGWHLVTAAHNAQRTWHAALQPALTLLKQMRWEALAEFTRANKLPDALTACVQALAQLVADWRRLQETGVFPENVREMISLAEQAQTQFFVFWQEQEQAPSRPLRWLIQMNQSAFSGIHQSLHQLTRHLQTLERTLLALARPGVARSRLAWNGAGDMMFALGQISALLEPPSRKPSRVRLWQEQYNQVLKQTEWKNAASLLETLDPAHPLAAWFQELASKDLDIFHETPRQKW